MWVDPLFQFIETDLELLRISRDNNRNCSRRLDKHLVLREEWCDNDKLVLAAAGKRLKADRQRSGSSHRNIEIVLGKSSSVLLIQIFRDCRSRPGISLCGSISVEGKGIQLFGQLADRFIDAIRSRDARITD